MTQAKASDVNYDHNSSIIVLATVITIVNYDRNSFIIQATGLKIMGKICQKSATFCTLNIGLPMPTVLTKTAIFTIWCSAFKFQAPGSKVIKLSGSFRF